MVWVLNSPDFFKSFFLDNLKDLFMAHRCIRIFLQDLASKSRDWEEVTCLHFHFNVQQHRKLHLMVLTSPRIQPMKNYWPSRIALRPQPSEEYKEQRDGRRLAKRLILVQFPNFISNALPVDNTFWRIKCSMVTGWLHNHQLHLGTLQELSRSLRYKISTLQILSVCKAETTTDQFGEYYRSLRKSGV